MKSNVKNYITLALCTLECLIFGGTIFGWPSLAYVYKDLGFFSCNNNETMQAVNGTQPCPDQDLYLPLALTVGIVGLGVAALPVGWLFDRFGLRVVRSIALVSGIAGSLVLAFTTDTSPFLIYLGTFLIGISSIIIIITNNHVALLAGVSAPTFNLIYGGAVNSSGVIFFLVKVAYDHGFSPRWSLIIHACLWVLVIITTFLLLPPYKVDFGEGDSAKKARAIRHPFSSKHSVRGFMANSPKMLNFLTLTAIPKERIETDNKSGPRQQTDVPMQSIWYHIKSLPYILHMLYFNIIYVWNGLVIGMLITWLSIIYEGDQVQVSYATNLYAYIQFGFGLVFSPFTGLMIGWVRLCLLRGMPENPSAALHVVVTAPGLLLACVSYILVAVFILLPLPASPYIVFVFMEIGRAFFYGTTVAFILIRFPLEYFGVLFGLMVMVSVGTLIVQYGYLRWVEASGYTQMTAFILGTIVLTLIHPIILIINYLRAEERNIIHKTKL